MDAGDSELKHETLADWFRSLIRGERAWARA